MLNGRLRKVCGDRSSLGEQINLALPNSTNKGEAGFPGRVVICHSIANEKALIPVKPVMLNLLIDNRYLMVGRSVHGSQITAQSALFDDIF
jgi:hypothetical protein